jgi:spermidine synthase
VKIRKLLAADHSQDGRSPVLSPRITTPWFGVLFSSGILASGAASLVNEVVWQRALPRFLGGSETLSSTLVVAAFMLGLGVGSWFAGRHAGRFRNPLGTLAMVEAGLAGTTLLAAIGLTGSRADGIIELQLSAVNAGLPVTIVFGCLAGIVLFVPCFLMGATMPLASEALQRALGHRNSRALGMLFGLNTLGAATGAIAAGYALVPLIGISSSLHWAVALNVLAALMFLGAGRKSLSRNPADGPPNAATSPRIFAAEASMRRAAVTMLALGFCSLGYEMALLRLFGLRRGPLPYTFAFVIAGFLIAWSVGAALSSRARRMDPAPWAGFCALTLLLPLVAYYLWWFSTGFGIPQEPTPLRILYRQSLRILTAGCFLPCGLFGFLFGTVTARAARDWGRDVGSLYAANTVGAVAGVVAIPLLGYEVPFPALLAGLAAILLLLQYFESLEPRTGSARYAPAAQLRRLRAPLTAGVAVALIAAGWTLGGRLDSGLSLWFSRAGVLGLDRAGNLYWDGLWHSRLADGKAYIGTSNWNMAALPAVSYSGPGIRDVCVIGLGTGITAAVIAQLESVDKVDIYEINRGLEGFHRLYPEGTLRALDHPKVEMRWQDARAGLRIRDDRYDLIITQPLYLKQAGSAFLNSREFLEIIRARLNPGGVFCLYSRGTEEQKLVMRQTAASVFPHGESFLDGYLLVLSSGPLDLSAEALRRRFVEYDDDPLWREIAANPETKSAQAVHAALDDPRLQWSAWGLNLTDDDPLIEYPDLLGTRLKWAEKASR